MCLCLILLIAVSMDCLFGSVKVQAAELDRPKLQAGEIQIEGEIRTINDKTKTWIVVAKSFKLPNGKQGVISPPKLKTINMSDNFQIFSLKDLKLAISQKDIFEWMIVNVIGTDAGSGKPINARVAYVDVNSGGLPLGPDSTPSKTSGS